MNITFTPLTEPHFPLLLKWLQRPHVKAWWDNNIQWTSALVYEKYITYTKNYKLENGIAKPIYAYIVCTDNVSIGYIQIYNAYDFVRSEALENLPAQLGALDIFIGEEHYLKQGLGSKIITQFLKEYSNSYTHIFVDPQKNNTAAIRTYEKLGFKKIKECLDTSELWLLLENPFLNIHFEKAKLQHTNTIFQWLAEPHMIEFWDNSPEHKEDILNFIHSRKQHYFYGTTLYWIGSIHNEPYCFILSDILQPEQDLSEIHRENLSSSGHTITLDFGIGNKKYLGQGLAAPTLEAFIQFYTQKIDPVADTFFLDPDENNPKAKRVYNKAGFKPVGVFNAASGAFKGNTNCLMVKKT